MSKYTQSDQRARVVDVARIFGNGRIGPGRGPRHMGSPYADDGSKLALGASTGDGVLIGGP